MPSAGRPIAIATGVRGALLHTLPGRAIVVGAGDQARGRRSSASRSAACRRSSASSTRSPALAVGGRRRATSSFRLIVLAQAAPAVARAPQADPLVHLHRLRPGAAVVAFFAAVRLPAVLQLQLVPGAEPAARAERSGALPRAEHGARDPARRRPRRRRHPRAAAGERGRASIPACRSRSCRSTRVRRQPTRRQPDGRSRRPASSTAGPWAHVDPPRDDPGVDRLRRVRRACWRIRTARRRRGRRRRHAPARARASRFPTPRPGYAVVVDLLVNDAMRAAAAQRDRRRAEERHRRAAAIGTTAQPLRGRDGGDERRDAAPRRRRLARAACTSFIDYRDWTTGDAGHADRDDAAEHRRALRSHLAGAGQRRPDASARACCSCCSSSARCS